MVIWPAALMVREMVALGVDEAVAPVVVTLALPVVRPEPALWVVLTDGLTVARRVDVLDVLDQVVLTLADLSFVHIARRPCWAGCRHCGRCGCFHGGRCGPWHLGCCCLCADSCGASRACCSGFHRGASCADGGVGHGRPRALREGGRVGTADAVGAFLHEVTAA